MPEEGSALFDCEKAESRTAKGKPTKVNVCPHCFAKGHLEVIRSQSQNLVQFRFWLAICAAITASRS